MSLSDALQIKVAETVARLDKWFETMRGPGGYCGPIAHWWESSLLYCGPMADWRYEGIICGYASLYRSTGESYWLERARQAGDDLVAAQLSSGKFRNSSFQQGPMEGGTPHEAAADVGLLELARVLREIGDETWQTYFETAERNLQGYILRELWHGKGFRDMPWNEIIVPNKNATIIEALVLYENLSGQDMSEYLGQAAEVILSAQEKTGPREGGIVHRGTGRHRLAVSIYTARAINGLLRLYERDHHDEWLVAISNALKYLRRLTTFQGVYWGYYSDGSLIANPRIVAGAGDVLRAMVWGHKYGICYKDDICDLVNLLVQSQLASGGIPTGYGFVQRGWKRKYKGTPEFRDVLPVVGWCDKTFRALSILYVPVFNAISKNILSSSLKCTWKKRDCIMYEDEELLILSESRSGRVVYSWHKGTCFPQEFLL